MFSLLSLDAINAISSAHRHFTADAVSAEELDALWADGWRHFGRYFFRTMLDILDDAGASMQTHADSTGIVKQEHQAPAIVEIIPLRINIQHFQLSKSQRRTERANADVQVIIEPVCIRDEHERLFELHARRFRSNAPDSLYTFLYDMYASKPCTTLQCCVVKHKQLIAASFFDVGALGISSIYAMFDPSEQKRRLGVFTLLQEVGFARQTRKHYVYLGYAHAPALEQSIYAYKWQFRGLEAFDWHRWHSVDHSPVLCSSHPLVA